MKAAFAAPLLLALSACATAPAEKGRFLTSYDQLTPRDGTVRVSMLERKAGPEAAAVRTVRLLPAEAHGGHDWLSDEERKILLRELDAQLCFEVSERYAIAQGAAPADAEVRAAVTRVKPTGRVGSAASAAASFFIPGPIGVRAPGSTGGLAAEAEMVGRDGQQLAALVWSRNATVVGTDNPSLSRIGDALQYAEPFADAAAAAMTPAELKPPGPPEPDPCAEYGPRIRPEGWLAKFATGLYVPQMSGARREAAQP
jgi:hypothetical protein